MLASWQWRTTSVRRKRNAELARHREAVMNKARHLSICLARFMARRPSRTWVALFHGRCDCIRVGFGCKKRTFLYFFFAVLFFFRQLKADIRSLFDLMTLKLEKNPVVSFQVMTLLLTTQCSIFWRWPWHCDRADSQCGQDMSHLVIKVKNYPYGYHCYMIWQLRQYHWQSLAPSALYGLNSNDVFEISDPLLVSPRSIRGTDAPMWPPILVIQRRHSGLI